MAHWIIEDHGFGGNYYRCSDCGEGFWDILDDVGGEDCCPKCGEPVDEDKNEYIEPHKTTKKRYICFTEEELTDLGKGNIIEIPHNNEVLYFMCQERYDEMVTEEEEE